MKRTPPTFDIVVAADERGGIGRDGGLPWRLRGDMSHFRELTSDAHQGNPNAVIMGRRTWESIPQQFRPLPHRLNLVISRNSDLALPEDVKRADSLAGALELAVEEKPYRIFVIGGAAIYREALDHDGLERIHLTRVRAGFDCDAFFDVPRDRFQLESASPVREERGIRYDFAVYTRCAESGCRS